MKQDKEAITDILSAIAQAQLALSAAERAFQDMVKSMPTCRERVERVWRGEWTGNFNAHCSRCDTFFSTMAFIGQGGNFCPNCGAPMTDEAVEMVMERLGVLYEKID